jgi:tetratricopeptide (TPR) repeat protein
LWGAGTTVVIAVISTAFLYLFDSVGENWIGIEADRRLHLLQRKAEALFRKGVDAGDNRALTSAIERRRKILSLVSRESAPLDWAAAQHELGDALFRLGERENGTARLNEAVSAYRAALEERTRDRAPSEWAATENSLGAALEKIGGRQGGTARLEEAIVAFRLALEERKRDRVPLDWAYNGEQSLLCR